MFKELMRLFTTDDSVSRMSRGFEEMIDRTEELTHSAGVHFFNGAPTEDERHALLEQDAEVNRLARRIRRQVAAHLATTDIGTPYALLLMSLVKDVESIGDYARRLAGVSAHGGGPLPENDDVAATLRDVRGRLAEIYTEVKPVFGDEDIDRARTLVDRALEVCRITDALPARVAAGSYDTATAVTLVSGSYFYQRIASHLLNVLSGVFLPLDQLDEYDEADLDEMRSLAQETREDEPPAQSREA